MSRTLVTVRRLDPSGEWTDVMLDRTNDLRQLQEAVGGVIEHVAITPRLSVFMNDCAQFERLPLNVPLSMLARQPLYGPAVLVNAETSDTYPPPECEEVSALVALAGLWSVVSIQCAMRGSDPYAYPNPDEMPPPVVLFGHDLAVFLGETSEPAPPDEQMPPPTDERRTCFLCGGTDHVDGNCPDPEERDDDGDLDYPTGGA